MRRKTFSSMLLIWVERERKEKEKKNFFIYLSKKVSEMKINFNLINNSIFQITTYSYEI